MRAAAPSAADLSVGDTVGDRLRAVPAADFAALMAPLGPFGPAPFLLVGVSGGPHSLALALLARDWVLARGGRMMAAICDHGLRPESGAEAASVAAMLAGQGVAARILALGVAPGPAMQDRARQARLSALLTLCQEQGAPWLLLGHHRADQAETVLLRALAGSGPAGLAGMGAARPAASALLLRPLLGIAPARLEAVVAAAGLAPVRDPSNADPRFTRVRLRAALADASGEGLATQALAEAAGRFSQRRAALAAAVAERLAVAARLHEAGFAWVDLAALGRDGVARAALAALVRALGGASFAPAETAIARLLETGHGTLGGVVLRRDGLLLREAAALAPPVPARPGATWDGRFRLAEAGGEGFMIGPAGPAARRLPRPAAIPAAIVPTLPALHRNGVLAVLPALAYPSSDVACRHGFVFAPIAGPVAKA
jgi:tRNA(Ile)-lysidine synthase